MRDYNVEELVGIAQTFDAVCQRKRNGGTSLIKYSFARQIAFSARRYARTKNESS